MGWLAKTFWGATLNRGRRKNSMLESIIIWTICALLALGIGWSHFEKKRTRDKLLQDLASMDRDHREKLFSRMRPELAMEVRQQLMHRFGVS